MKALLSVLIAATIILAAADLAAGQAPLPKYADDGSKDYAQALIAFHQETGGRIAKKKDTQPFAISFFGWKAMRLTLLPYNAYQGAHIGLCSTMIGFYDDGITATLKPLSERSKSVNDFVKATEPEKSAIQGFVVQKYTKKYVFDIDNLGLNPRKSDPLSAWKYELGSSLGEIAGMLTQWFSLPDNAKFDASVSESLSALDKRIKDAPPGVSPEVTANLRKLSAFGSQSRYSLVNQHQIGAALKAVLLSTMSFVD